MIFIKNPTWIKIWEVNPKEKYIDIRFSTSEKKEDGSYTNSNWFGRCLGKARNKIIEDNIQKGDKIRMTSGKITAEVYLNDKGEKRTAPVKILIFDYDNGENSNNASAEPSPKKSKRNTTAKAEKAKPAETSSDDDDDYPF